MTGRKCAQCGRVRDTAYLDRSLIHQSVQAVWVNNPRHHEFVPPKEEVPA